MKIKSILLGLAALATVSGSAAHAGVNLVTNGGFEHLSNGPGEIDYTTVATGWTSNGYNFVYNSGTADFGGAEGQSGNVQLWGPQNGSANGLPASSPTGGNFLAADGAYIVAPIQQMINGLVVGDQYRVIFDWAGAQQKNFDGVTTEQWKVTFGGQEIDTDTVTNLNHGFTGWQHESFVFTATSVSQLLSFLAVGTPDGEPPFSLLDGVGVVSGAVPEPATWAMMILGMGAVGAASRLRRRRNVAVTA